MRQVLNVGDLNSFTAFLKLCAGRTGQELNLASLGSDAGVSHNTARAWFAILESSFLVLRVPGWYPNLRKQLVKTPKLHFLDSGLACHLLGIRESAQLFSHPSCGTLFENWAVAEIYKTMLHAGEVPSFYHYRESRGIEVDLIIARGDKLRVIEIKSSATAINDHFRNLVRFKERLHDAKIERTIDAALVYAGDESLQRTAGRQAPWREVGSLALT